MSKKSNRIKEILTFLHNQGEVSVKELAQYLLTSEMTIRRDLNFLEEEKIVRRIHGGAVLNSSYLINTDIRYLFGEEIEKSIEQKNLIGHASSLLIKNDETIGFDIGTTIPFIARNLNRDISITAVCTTFECAIELYNKKNINLLITGGFLHRESDVFRSEEGVQILKKTRMDKAFISAGGIDADLGLTCYHEFHIEIKKLLMESSKQVILIADSSKFGHVKPSYFANLSDIDTLITDKGIPDTYRKLTVDLGIELIIAGE